VKNVKSVRETQRPLAMVIAGVLASGHAGAASSCPVSALVHDVQGSPLTQLAGGAHNDQSPLAGRMVTVEGVVVGAYQSSAQLRGFFLQEEAADEDGDPTTSEGVFVFSGSTPALAVAEGERVCVTGVVAESLGMTRINATASGASMSLSAGGNNLADVATPAVTLPVVGDINDFYEQFEGMRVRFADPLVVADAADLDRFGALTLTAGGRPMAYSQEDSTPTQAEYLAWLDALSRRSVLLDDDDDTQYSALPAGMLPYPQPAGFGVGTQGSDFFRAGDSVTDLLGIVSWTNGGLSGANAWRLRPVASNPVAFAVDNPRSAATPATIGDLRVVEFNLADYFTTIDTTGGWSAPAGADSAAEFERQSAKLVAALAALDADVIAVMEVENDGGFTLQELANRLNAQTGVADYDSVAVSALGLDATAVGLIYRNSVVQPTGAPAVLSDVAYTTPNGGAGPVNPPALAQTFSVAQGSAAGEKFTVVVTQLKNRTSTGAVGADLDQWDGQGAFNDSRTKAAQYLVNTWLATDPTGQGESDVLVVGDLSAYRHETPLAAFTSAGYGDLIALYQGADAYSTSTAGVAGYLDHALASATLLDQVVGTAVWHINADEVEAFDYNDTIQDPFGEQFAERKPSGRNLYAADEFRSSDHDPVVVDLALAPPPPPPPAVMRGDADGDADIDRDDLKLINRTKREPATGADDPSDVDGDGYITVDDVKLARDLCTRPHCATATDASAGDKPGGRK
jgi:uncharacterized protein